MLGRSAKMKPAYIILSIFLFANCKRSEVEAVTPEELISSSELAATPKNKDLEQALSDVAIETAKFDAMNPEDLISSIIESKNPMRFGGYEYFYSSQLNHRIIEDLRRRGEKARAALIQYQNSKLLIYEAINGPGDTIGTLCRQLERELDNTKPAQ
jgi:hypothetical protein